MAGCGTTSDSDPLVPEIVSISIDEANETTRIHSLSLDTDNDQLTATVLYSDGESSQATYQLEWDSNDSNVATVLNGKVTAADNNGSALISASFRDKLFTGESKKVEIIPLSDINITTDATDINISYENNVSRLDINMTGSYPLLANGTFEDNATISAISSSIEWSSSNVSVATIDSAGVLTIIGSGLADINASVYNEINSTLELNVTLP